MLTISKLEHHNAARRESSIVLGEPTLEWFAKFYDWRICAFTETRRQIQRQGFGL